MSIEVELTPNRGDCFSVEGIAREVGVLTRCEVSPLDCSPVIATITDTFPVNIHTPQACPRYLGRIIKNINANVPTPLWIQERLRRSGLRSISAVVDVTNYVLLELGQPMHAFDFAYLSGSLQVRMAQAGESLTLLDEQTVQLDEQTLVIANEQQPLAMAGIMGGQVSAVTIVTEDLFLESAFFAPKPIVGCARRYGLHTDSSHRFERGVDPQLQRRAIERATALLLEIVGGQPGPIIEVVDETSLPVTPTIKLRASRIQRLLGQSLETTEVTEILTRLGMTIKKQQGDHWQVSPPTFRFDISIEADLIEELARVYGYNHLPSQAPHSHLTMHTQPTVTLEQVQMTLVQRDYQEAITYSFVDFKQQTQLNPEVESIPLANPIASDMSVMRTTLWTGLLQVLQFNQKRQQHRVRLFETGLRFMQSKNHTLQQEKMIAGLVTGTRWPEQWGQTEQTVDFFDVKADIEALLSLSTSSILKKSEIDRFIPSRHPALHPEQTAEIYRGDEWIGVLGAVHPNLVQILELISPVYLFELRLAPLFQAHPVKFKEISKYPSIKRDIAVVVSESISVTQLLDCIKQNADETLTEWQLFDVYRGQNMSPGKKSLAIRLIFQAFSRNLTDDEVETVIEQILKKLEENLDAKLRT